MISIFRLLRKILDGYYLQYRKQLKHFNAFAEGIIFSENDYATLPCTLGF